MALETLDRFLVWMRGVQRRYHSSDYQDLSLRDHWNAPPEGATYRDVLVDVTPHAQSLRTVLIYKPDEIGDCVQSLPAIAELRRALPHARLFLICQKTTEELFRRTGLVDEIATADVSTWFLRFPIFSIRKAVSKFTSQDFDMAIFLRGYPAYFRQFKKIPARIHWHPRDPRLKSKSIHRPKISLWGESRKHQSLQMLEIVAPLTKRRYELSDVLYPLFQWVNEDRSAVEQLMGEELQRPFLVVHPTSREETRQYPFEYWVEVLVTLYKEFGLPIVSVGAANDLRLPNFTWLKQANGKLSLTQSAYLISRAKAFIGVDSGPAHIASSVGTPTITIKGGQSYAPEWAPLGQSLVIRADVPCAPCHRRVCPGFKRACLTELTPEKILPEIRTWMKTIS